MTKTLVTVVATFGDDIPLKFANATETFTNNRNILDFIFKWFLHKRSCSKQCCLPQSQQRSWLKLYLYLEMQASNNTIVYTCLGSLDSATIKSIDLNCHHTAQGAKASIATITVVVTSAGGYLNNL